MPRCPVASLPMECLHGIDILATRYEAVIIAGSVLHLVHREGATLVHWGDFLDAREKSTRVCNNNVQRDALFASTTCRAGPQRLTLRRTAISVRAIAVISRYSTRISTWRRLALSLERCALRKALENDLCV